jgi:hypothetical protein
MDRISGKDGVERYRKDWPSVAGSKYVYDLCSFDWPRGKILSGPKLNYPRALQAKFSSAHYASDFGEERNAPLLKQT